MESKACIGCPRCNGDLYIFSNLYGQFEQCLHCGYTKDLEKPEPVLYPIDVKTPSKKEVEFLHPQSSDLSKSVVK